MYDLIIKNANIYNGTGNAPMFGHVFVKNGKIVSVEKDMLGYFSCDAENAIDAQGMDLAPGFIDSHSHADESIFADPKRDYVLKMGVTTEVAGQCGHTSSPFPENVDRKFFAMASGNYGGKPYECFSDMAADVEKLSLGPNQIWFTGHGALRTYAMGGFENRKASPQEIGKMQELLRREMEGGALGFTSGLAYVPGIYSDAEELSQIALAMKSFGGIYSSHTRSESAGLFDAVKECIYVTRKAGVRANISHFKACYPEFWDRMDRALQMVDEARAEGLDITMDAYPYIAVSTTTLSAMPSQFLTGGAEAFAESLKDPNVAEAVRREIYEIDSPTWDNALKHAGPDKFLIVRAEDTPWIQGKTYTEVAEEMHLDPFDAVIWALRENHGKITDVRFIMTEENVEKVLKHPVCTVGSDGIYVGGRDTSAHPRAFGTFPRYLGHYIREREILSREEGIRRITGLPAERYGLKTKGFVKPGYDADLVLFDYDTIQDGADFKDQTKPNKGISKVIVGGNVVVNDNVPTGIAAGKFLRRT